MGVFAAVGFGIGVLVLVLSHGNSPALKLFEPLLTGALGVLCLASLAVRRPLLLFAPRVCECRRLR